MSDDRQAGSMTGFVIGHALLPNFIAGMFNCVWDLFIYSQQAFIKKVNNLASCGALHISVLDLMSMKSNPIFIAVKI